jgi:predicted metal-dependent phosphoesterase TrpH
MVLPNPDCIDLHLHSTLSDGLLAPSQLIGRLADARISIACFTDHNSVHPRHADLADYARRRHNVTLPFPGSEVTVTYRDPRGRDRAYVLHILAYGGGVLHPRFQRWLSQPNRFRREYLTGVHRRLIARGFPLPPFDDLYRTGDPVETLDCEQMLCSRTPLARALGEILGVSAEEAKERHIPRQPEGGDKAERLDAFELLDWAKKLGFALIVAHPGRVRDESIGGTGGFEDQLGVIAELAERGVDGVEVCHRRNNAFHTGALRRLARRMDLLTTGGSDFHGKPECALGEHVTSPGEFERLRERIGEKQHAAGR